MKSGQRIERIEFCRSPELPGVESLLAEHSARKWRWFHETYTFCTGLKLLGPEFGWTYRRKTYRSKAGAVNLMEPGEVHANIQPTAPADFRVLFVSPALIERAAEELGLASAVSHLRLVYVADPAFFQAFARLHVSLESESTALERQSRFAGCIRLFLEQCTERAPATPVHPGHSALSRARAFIQQHYAENITLDEVASAAGLSRFHLVRAFASEFGIPPHAYQLQVRLAQGLVLLAVGTPPAMVAAELGYADQSHFTRHFKRILGVTPQRYQQEVRPGTWYERNRPAAGDLTLHP